MIPISKLLNRFVTRNHLTNLGRTKVIFSNLVKKNDTITFENINNFRFLIFRNRFNGATSILSKDEGYVGKKFEITTSASDSSGFAFVSGVIENYTSALIEYVSTTSVGISEYNRLIILGIY